MLDVAKHLAVLTYGLCRPRRLPSLVTDIVAGYLDDPASIILVLSAVSKRLHQYAASVIYQEIKLDFQEDGRAVRKSALLSRTLRANEVAASSVRSLIFTGCIFPGSVRGHELEDLDSDNATQYVNALVDCASGDFSLNRARPMTLRASMSHASVPEFCCQILNLCREVRELTIASALLEYPGFYNIVGPGRPVTLQNLRTADFCIDLDTTHTEPYDPHLYVVKDWDATLLGLFSLLCIDSVSVVMTLASDITSQLRASSITRLDLCHCQSEPSALCALLAATPKLRFLEYRALVDWNWWLKAYRRYSSDPRPRLDVGLEVLFEALHHVSDTLEVLKTSHEYVMNQSGTCFEVVEGGMERDHGPADRHLENLSMMKRLHTLEIPHLSLFGRQSHSYPHQDWRQTLPPSLDKLTLTDHLDESYRHVAEDEALIPIISSLLGWLATCREAGQPLQFGVVCYQSCSADYKLPFQTALYDLCRTRGIQYSFEKLANGGSPGESWTSP